MAEGLVDALYADRFDGRERRYRRHRVHPAAIEAMAEIGIDISGHRSKSIDEFVDRKFDLVVTVCDNDAKDCPFFPGAKDTVHHAFDDPAACSGRTRRFSTAFGRPGTRSAGGSKGPLSRCIDRCPDLPVPLPGGLGNLAAYLAAHVLLCLVPAFFIAGAMTALIPKESVTRFLGRLLPKAVSYPAAALAGSVPAVCSCTIVPLFAGIYKKGAGSARPSPSCSSPPRPTSWRWSTPGA